MRASSLLTLLLFLGASTALATTEFEQARALFDAKRYPEARVMLEKIVAAEPTNAAACHYLGRVLAARNDPNASEEALPWLEKAVELEPKNPVYLGIYGGTSLQIADKKHSISAALKGRDAMEKAVAIDPGYLDARDGLFQLYQRAPWPIGSSAKAAAHLEEIRKRDPDRATILGAIAKTNAKDFDAAFRICDEALAQNPNNYVALYQYGRTAAVSGRNLERGLERLKQCLTIEPPNPSASTHSHAWNRIGNILEQLKRPTEARAAYETALRLDAGNRQASDALAKLGK